MSRLVIVYHRQPYEEVRENGKTVFRENSSPNGIVPTLKGFFGRVSKGAWVAWKKVRSHDAPPSWPRTVNFKDEWGDYDVVRLPLTKEQVSAFYHITSKEAMWPLLHSFPWQFDATAADWETFREVNERFAEAACEQVDDDGVVWVHDYNLWLVPHYVRKLKPGVKIAFFHHTPFPAPDIFSILPWRAEIIDSLLCCDLVGFHIPRYANNFAQAARSLRCAVHGPRVDAAEHLRAPGQALSEATVVPHLTTKSGHKVLIDAYPVSTSPEVIDAHLAKPEAEATIREIRDQLGEGKLIVSVGRVDYVKGTREMLLAFERLLERRPDLHGKVKLAVTSVRAASGMRSYRKAQEAIERLAGRINGRFNRLDWSPILLSTNPMPFDELVAWYKASDVAWITPLRDGLNLVAKEFVAAHNGDDGVLVLSEFCGVAVTLPEALLVNPYDVASMDQGIERALEMPEEERRSRAKVLNERVRQYDIDDWARHVFGHFEALGVHANELLNGDDRAA